MRKDNLLVLQTRKASQLNAANMPRIVAQPSVAIKQKVPSEVAPEVVVSVEQEEVVSHCSSSVQIFMSDDLEADSTLCETCPEEEHHHQVSKIFLFVPSS